MLALCVLVVVFSRIAYIGTTAVLEHKPKIYTVAQAKAEKALENRKMTIRGSLGVRDGE